jgi:SAM-dependent MidA family methyltransferase
MAADLLDTLREQDDSFSRAVSYLIVEPFDINQIRQKDKLHAFPEVRWVDSIDDLPEFTGIHLSNELLDAFPVDSLRWDGESWQEECVANTSGTLTWSSRPITDPNLTEAAKLLPLNLPEGFRLEVNPGMKPWLVTLHSKLQRGLILTVDYGQAGDDRYAPHRADGTLLAFQNHQRFNDPLPQPGQRDITAQVDFTAFGRLAQEVGFELLGYSDQHHFLVGAAEPWPRSLGDSQIREMLQGRISAPFRPFSTPARWVSSSRQLPLGKTFQQILPSAASSMRARGLAYFELNVSRGGAEARSGIKEGYPVHPLG